MTAPKWAAGVLFDEAGAVLLAQRSQSKKVAPGAWHLPGGTVEHGETYEQALVRELKEELDLDITETLATGAEINYERGMGSIVTKIYLVAATNAPRIANYETQAIAFVQFDDLASYLEPQFLDENRHAVTLAAALVK